MTFIKIGTSLLLLCWLCKTGQAQSISRESISVAGAYTETDDVHLSFTVGEMIANTSRSSHLILTQGFEQSKIKVVLGFGHKDFELDMVAYPNPTRDVVTLALHDYAGSKLYYTVYSLQGLPLLANRQVELGFTQQAQIDFTTLPVGLYHVVITTADEKLVKTLKIYKLE